MNFRSLYHNIYHRYSFLRFFPNTTIFNKFKCYFINLNSNYFNIIVNNSLVKFINYPYDMSIPINGYLKYHGIEKDDIVIDGGAFEGVFSIVASKLVGSNGLVIAFEPDPENYRNLLKNIELNEIKNIIAINKGLWKKDSIIEFMDAHNGSSSFIHDKNAINLVEIPVVSLDSELNRLNLERVNFLKLDVEGAEFEVIEGFSNTLAKCNVKIAIASYHVRDGHKTCFNVEKMLSRLGYTVKTDFSEHLTTYGNKKSL